MFWRGGMPTQLVTKPSTYQAWESAGTIALQDTRQLYPKMWAIGPRVGSGSSGLPAGGRVRTSARVRVEGLRNGTDNRLVSGTSGTIPAGGKHSEARRRLGYCEYTAILVRAVLGNPKVFPESQRWQSQPSPGNLRQPDAMCRDRDRCSIVALAPAGRNRLAAPKTPTFLCSFAGSTGVFFAN